MDIEEDRIASLLRQPSEGLQVEIKNWLDPRGDESIAKIIKAVFAIRNRNGGFLIIGFDNKSLTPDRYSLNEDVDKLYHPDTIQGLVSRYANSPFEVSVEIRERDGQSHPVIVVPEGVQVPVVAKRDLVADGGKKLLEVGDVYFRTLLSNGTPSSARILPADYPELMDICFENREADIGRFLRRHLSGVDTSVVDALIGKVGAEPVKQLRERSFDLIERGRAAFEAEVERRNAASELQSVQGALTMRVGLVLDPAKPDEMPTKEFMNRISASNPQYTGWPAWLDSRDFVKEEHRAYVINGVWQALIVQLDGGWGRHVEFLRFDPKGEFYLQRVMQDDLSDKVSAGTAMDIVLMIYRVAEVLAVGVGMARSLGWEPDSTAGFAFRWTGLEGRELRSWVNPLGWNGGEGSQSRSGAADSYVELPLEIPHSALAPHVGLAVGPLFASFDGYMASQEIIETSIRKMIRREMDS